MVTAIEQNPILPKVANKSKWSKKTGTKHPLLTYYEDVTNFQNCYI